MPETIRTGNERLRSRPWRGGFCRLRDRKSVERIEHAGLGRERADARGRARGVRSRDGRRSTRARDPHSHARAGLLRAVCRYGAAAHAPQRQPASGRLAPGGLRAACRNRSAEGAADVRPADPDRLDGGSRRTRDHRRSDRSRRRSRPIISSPSAPGSTPTSRARCNRRSSGCAARARFLHAADHPARPSHRGGGTGDRRLRGGEAARSDRDQARSRRTEPRPRISSTPTRCASWPRPCPRRCGCATRRHMINS